MTKESVYEKVVQVIKDKQGQDFAVSPELSIKDELGADSVDLMEFILTLEDEFEIEISDEAIDQMTKVDDLVSYISQELA